MKKRTLVVAPGRGTYNKSELGTLARAHSNKIDLINQFDTYRSDSGQEKISVLDGATRFSTSKFTRGDKASPLIFACGFADFLSIDPNLYEIVAITGNSMGWYTALACAGDVSTMGGFKIANTMGTLMQKSLIGGQIIYPFVDTNWVPMPGVKENVLNIIEEINFRENHFLTVSIELGGMLVLAGDDTGLRAFEAEVPVIQERFPMRLVNHAAFHSALQKPVVAQGRAELSQELFSQPEVPLIDGRGKIWYPKACSLPDLYNYTLGHQIIETYNFSTAVSTAAFEFMPDSIIILGPGTSLFGATAQALVMSGWRNLNSKEDFKSREQSEQLIVSLGESVKCKK